MVSWTTEAGGGLISPLPSGPTLSLFPLLPGTQTHLVFKSEEAPPPFPGLGMKLMMVLTTST